MEFPQIFFPTKALDRRISQAGNQHEASSMQGALRPVTPTRLLTFVELHGVISQKVFIDGMKVISFKFLFRLDIRQDSLYGRLAQCKTPTYTGLHTETRVRAAIPGSSILNYSTIACSSLHTCQGTGQPAQPSPLIFNFIFCYFISIQNECK
jgi:hypothetical protein